MELFDPALLRSQIFLEFSKTSQQGFTVLSSDLPFQDRTVTPRVVLYIGAAVLFHSVISVCNKK
jgi:hypothetical protein